MDIKAWRDWTNFAASHGHEPFLPTLQQHTMDRANLFLAFAHSIREGRFDNGIQVTSQKVATTLRLCARRTRPPAPE